MAAARFKRREVPFTAALAEDRLKALLRLIEEGESIVVLTHGSFVPSSGGQTMRFVTSEVFTFRGHAVSLETYQVLLS
jgi:hypothetical protein